MEHKEQQLIKYKAALCQLPPVNYATVRALLGHLCDVAAQSAVNKATYINLARVFGPTLMNTNEPTQSTSADVCQVCAGV